MGQLAAHPLRISWSHLPDSVDGMNMLNRQKEKGWSKALDSLNIVSRWKVESVLEVQFRTQFEP